MPRKPSIEPQRQRHQERQARYRLRLREENKPEADAVDAALASAICRSALEERATPVRDEAIKAFLSMVLKDTRRELVSRGYDRHQATGAIQRRLNRVQTVTE